MLSAAFGRHTCEEHTTLGASSPAKPALVKLERLSKAMGCTSSSCRSTCHNCACAIHHRAPSHGTGLRIAARWLSHTTGVPGQPSRRALQRPS